LNSPRKYATAVIFVRYTLITQEVNERRALMNTIMKRKVKLIGHLIRHNEFITIIMEGKIDGKRT